MGEFALGKRVGPSEGVTPQSTEQHWAALPEKRIPSLLRKPWIPLFLIWVLAVVLRVILSQMDRVVWGDEPFYLWLGRNWITGRGFSFTSHPDVHHGPLFPWLAGLFYLLTHDMALSSELLYTLFGSLLIWPVYAMGLELYDRRVGLSAAALTAVFPSLTAAVLHWGTMTEPIYMFFIYLGLWAGLVASRPWRHAVPAFGAAHSDDGLGEGRPAGDLLNSSTRRTSPWWACAMAGLAFGLAYLARPEAVGYFVLTGAFVILLRSFRTLALRRRLAGLESQSAAQDSSEQAKLAPRAVPSLGRFWLKILLYIVAFGIAFGPYAYYVRLNTGKWMVSEKVGVAYLTGVGLAQGDTAAFDRATWGLDSTGLETFFFSSESYNISMLDLILTDLRTFAIILYINAQRFVRVTIGWTLFPYLLLPLVVLGLFSQGWTRERTLKELFLLTSIVPVLSFILFYIQERYLVPMIPILILWTALGLSKLSDWFIGTVAELRTSSSPQKRRGTSHWHMPNVWRAVCQIGPVLLTVVALLLVHPHVIDQVTQVGSMRPEHKVVGEYLASIVPHATPDSPSDVVIMSRYPAIAFHADANWVPTPNASWPEVLVYAQHKGVGYFVIDERELHYRPQFKDLVTGEQTPTELELVHTDDSSDERLVVFRLR